MMMIEISESKADMLKEHAEKVLKHGGKLMQCIEELCEEGGLGERVGYGNRGDGGRYGMRGGNSGGGYGNRMGYRDEEEMDDDDPYMGERRGRSSHTGRFVHR